MSTVHRALFMIDVLLEIFAHLPVAGSAATSPVLVHSLWSELFLNKIWQTLTTVDPIFHILFCALSEAGDVSIILKPTTYQLERCSYYSKRVKFLHITQKSKNSFSDTTVYETLPVLTNTPIFPNLIGLTWLRTTDVVHSMAFMHSHLSVFRLRIPYIQLTTPMPIFLADAVKLMPFLTSLEFEQRIPTPGMNTVYTAMARKLQHLRSFKLACHLDSYLFQQLAKLPHLRYIRAIYGSQETNETQLPHDIPANGFPCLRSLKLTVGLRMMSRVLGDDSCLNALQALTLRTSCPDVETTPGHLRVFLRVLAQTCCQLMIVKLDLQTFRPSFPSSGEEDHIRVADIAPLFAVRCLSEFHLRHSHPLHLHNDDLATLGDAWPNLERLTLNDEPCAMEDPILTLEVLEIIGQRCARLQQLAIDIDGHADILNLHPPAQLTRLTDLWIGVGAVQEYTGWIDCALYLSRALSSSTRIHTNKPWWYVNLRITEDDPVLGLRDKELIDYNCRMWKWVVYLIRVLQRPRL